MKKLLPFMAVVVIFLGTVSLANAEYINYSGLWEPTDGDVNAVKISSFGDFKIYILNSNKDGLLIMDNTQRYTTVYFTEVGNDWYAGLQPNATTLNLGINPYFYLSFDNVMNYQYAELLESKIYEIIVNFGNQTGKIWIVDAKPSLQAPPPVPLPGTALLLGSGLVGVALVWRRRQRRL